MFDPVPGDQAEEIDINIRSGQEIDARIRILIALTVRAFMELQPDAATSDETGGVAGERFDLLAWLSETGALTHATAWEREVLECAPGALATPDAHTATWSVEALAALATALSAWFLPTWEPVPVDPRSLLEALPSPVRLDEPEPPPLQIPDDAVLERWRETAELWHWRVLLESERRAAHRDERAELASLIADVAQEAAEAGVIDTAIDRDFPFDGKPFRSIGDHYLERALPIAEQRLAALNWLCGFGDSWESVPLEV